MLYMGPIRPVWSSRCLSLQPYRFYSSTRRNLDQQATATEDAASDTSSTVVKASRQVIFSGIQPTGVPHLGNYLGALRQWKDFQDAVASTPPEIPKNYLNYCIVDLHALTGSITGPALNRLRHETLASLLAIGLSPKHSNLFIQSDIPHHSELMWILSTLASTGYLSRMTQWKSKLNLPSTADLTSSLAKDTLKLGLFSYPVLQAADILLYGSNLVPVGEDQAQHIEFARTLARSFNAHFGPHPATATHPSMPVFTLPDPLISPAKRIMSLRVPTVKMSKSHPDPKSRILITDSAETIHDKLKIAVTDSHDGIAYDPHTRPGISNLIDILKHVTRSDMTPEDIGIEFRNTSKKAFKEHVGEEIDRELSGVRERFGELMGSRRGEVEEARRKGRKEARARAGGTLNMVRRVVGLEDGVDGEGGDGENEE